MSRKHNTKHLRGFSTYVLRLQARGLAKAPKPEPLELLRSRQICKQHSVDTTVNKWECATWPHN